jgi:uncharacterized protein YlzI (FlbEa/FlbD family)
MKHFLFTTINAKQVFVFPEHVSMVTEISKDETIIFTIGGNTVNVKESFNVVIEKLFGE